MRSWSGEQGYAQQIQHVETLEAYQAHDKLRAITQDSPEGLLEIVLHNSGDGRIIESFVAFAQTRHSKVITDRIRNVRGLTFIPVRTAFTIAEELARFSFVRVARAMPILRPIQVPITRSLVQSVKLSTEDCSDPSFRAVIFDGGIPNAAIKPLDKWVSLIEPTGIGKAVPGYEEHGLGVTSALLFGPLKSNDSATQPICKVDHVRVLDAKTGTDFDYIDVLDRIVNHLDNNPAKYQFVNLSIGPNLPAQDDEVTYWTAALDQRFAHGRVLATVAVGNEGSADPAGKLNRVQPPSDGVNVLAVGASSSPVNGSTRASYSCVGPGRSPGFVKPDGIIFGGDDTSPFGVLTARGSLSIDYVAGTSFASPFALRSGTALRAQLGDEVSPLALRSLLIHRANPEGHPRSEVGWGHFESDPIQLITCDDNEALVIYQGVLPIGEHLRAKVPMPQQPLTGDVYLTATLVIAPEVDPEHASAYTRAGLEVVFRPNKNDFTIYKNGKQSKHPTADGFFSAVNLYHAPEYLLRAEDFKWEPCRRNTKKYDASKLDNPCFDIYYHNRESAANAQLPDPIPYTLIISVKAPEVKDLYNRIVRAYSGILIPIKPRIRIEVKS